VSTKIPFSTFLETNGGGSLAAFAKVSVPEQASGYGAPGTPRRAHFLQSFRRGALAKSLYFLHGGSEREIAYRPNIWAAQSAEKVDIRGPRTDAFQGQELFASKFILEFVEFVQRESLLVNSFGKKACVMGFLAAEAEPTHFTFGEFKKAAGCEWLNSVLQAEVQRAGRGKRNLLLQDDVNQGGKTWLSRPKRRQSVFLDYSGQILVSFRKFASREREELLVQNNVRCFRS
jgi:hypothetical protein